MKIVHINTWDTGGAANAAIRIFRAQKLKGMEVSFLSLKALRSDVDDLNNYESFLIKKYGKFISKLIILSNKIYNQIPVKFNKNLFFNRPETLFAVHKHPLIQEADIVHFHSIVKFIDIPSFFKNVKKPVVWTMHDMNPFCGGMHYNSMMNKSLNALESKFITTKKRAFAQSNIHAVGPSKWIQELAGKSELFGEFPNYVIPNCINRDVFSRVENQREVENPKILFVAENINDPRKGIPYLLEALKFLDKNIQLMILGNVTSKEKFADFPNITFLGFVSLPNDLSKIYSEADVYVISSIEDNLPNTIVESHMCGTPVVGFRTSGVENMITHKFDGILVDRINGEALAEGIKEALKLKQDGTFLTDEIIKKSQAYYAEEKVLNAYSEVYQKALPSK